MREWGGREETGDEGGREETGDEGMGREGRDWR